MLISDDTVAKVIGQNALSRDHWKRIQHMRREEMERYLVEYYRTAFEDGANAVATIEVPWDRILEVISKVKGVGPALLQRIDEAVRGEFE